MIAGLIGGKVVGDPQAKVNNFAKIEEGTPGCISFLANEKYEHYIYTTDSSVVLVNETFEPKQELRATLIKVPDAREAVAQLLQIYESMKPKKVGISELAFVDPTATVGKDVYLAPFVAIGPGAKIGDGCVLHPHVTVGQNAIVGDNTEIYSNAVIYHDCRVGKRCILHAGCVIGADGFGFQPTEKGYDKIPQIGIAVIEDDVEIGANTCVDRAVMGATVIHSGVKLDNLVQIAHNDEDAGERILDRHPLQLREQPVGQFLQPIAPKDSQCRAHAVSLPSDYTIIVRVGRIDCQKPMVAEWSPSFLRAHSSFRAAMRSEFATSPPR